MNKQRKAKSTSWRKKTPNKEGWYWCRDDYREAVLHVFDPLGDHPRSEGNGYFKAWGPGKAVLFKGIVSCFTNVHDNEEGEA